MSPSPPSGIADAERGQRKDKADGRGAPIADIVVQEIDGDGTQLYEGTVEGLRSSGTLTGRHLDDRASLKPEFRSPTGKLEIRGADTNNLDNVDVDIPLGVLTVLTGWPGRARAHW